MEVKPIRQKWKGTMTDRERFLNQMRYKSFDRSFNMEFNYWNECFTQWDIFVNNGIKDYQANDFFSFDKFLISWEKTNCWLNPRFEEKVIEEKENTLIMMDLDGIICEVPKDRHGTIPRGIRASVVTPDDWKRVKEERLRLDDLARKINIEEFKKEFPAERDFPMGIDYGAMIGRIRNLLTFEGLAYACYDYPDMVDDMVETACQLALNFMDQVLPHVKMDFAMGWEDICFKNGPAVTLDFFKEILLPRYKRIGKKLKEYGIDIWFVDCDGDVRPLIPHMLDAGINCLFPYEVMACGHPSELLAEYGGELRIMGGVDKIKLIEGKEATREYLESLVPLVEQGGFIPFCDHLCPPDVKPENYLYYLDLKEKLFGMKA